MVVGAAGNKPDGFTGEGGSHALGVLDDLLHVAFESGLQGFAEADGFGGDGVHEWAALCAGEDS